MMEISEYKVTEIPLGILAVFHISTSKYYHVYRCEYRRVLDLWLDLLHSLVHRVSTIYVSLLHTLVSTVMSSLTVAW
jgi:hypothetical protein